jgi:PIN domain nuclease of toxin-antitoxin system
MPNVVADTHALIWHLTDPRKLGRGARRELSAADAGRIVCHVPAVVLVETWLIHERGRLRVGPAQVLESLAGHPGYAVLALDIEQVLELGRFPMVRDPMDRLVLAAAAATRSRLVSRDEALDGHGVERVWD